MNNLRNKVQLIGRLGQDPEVKRFNDDKMLARFSMATSETYRDNKGMRVENTQWHNVIAWGKLAGLAESYLKKGKEICVEGRLSHRKYADKSGITRNITEIVASDLLMIGKKEEAA
jgi:single-strand DNA-binding protein